MGAGAGYGRRDERDGGDPGTVADGIRGGGRRVRRGTSPSTANSGAAFALYVDGEPKVDIWGGIADKSTGRPWTEDTLQLVYSTTKGAAAICVARLVEAGKMRYDDRVADHWPEFAANGKEDVTVAS